MSKLHLILAVASVALIGSPVVAKAPAASATTSAGFTCKDGSHSDAKTKQGACSSHGGVASATAATAATVTTPAATTSTTTTKISKATTVSSGGHTAMCNDGTYSDAKQHSGACSHHKGVKTWLDGK